MVMVYGKKHSNDCAYIYDGSACDCGHAQSHLAIMNSGFQDPIAPTPTDLEGMLSERGKRYGKFTGHAVITQTIKRAMREYKLPCKDAPDFFYIPFDLLAEDQKEALDMVAHKIGCILNGDPDYADSWDDIAGYAKLVGDRLNGKVV